MIGGKKGGLNPYFKLKEEARKKNLDSFEYNGCTYKKKITKTGMPVYKKVITSKCPAPEKKKKKKKSKKDKKSKK